VLERNHAYTRAGGAHVFTVPWYWWKDTLIRAVCAEDGTITHIEKPEYHGNPIDSQGSLVVTEWGRDLCDFIYRASRGRDSVEGDFEPGDGSGAHAATLWRSVSAAQFHGKRSSSLWIL
jgi:hypothetical protein